MTRGEMENALRRKCVGKTTRHGLDWSLADNAPYILVASECLKTEGLEAAAKGMLWCLANVHWPMWRFDKVNWYVIRNREESSSMTHFLARADAELCGRLRGRVGHEYERVGFASWVEALAEVSPLYERDTG